MNRPRHTSSRFRPALVASLAAATVAAGLALPLGAAQAAQAAQAVPAAAAARTATDGSGARYSLSGNLSDNPVLRRSLRGYHAADGVKRLERVKIRKHRGARHAARAIPSSTDIRISLPRERTSGGSSVFFSADVRTPVRARGHLSVSWYDANGRWLSWNGGNAADVPARTWKPLQATLTAPAGAAVAETVVNVLGVKPGTSVKVTRHVVRNRTVNAPAPAPTAPGTTAPVTTAPRPTDPGTTTPAPAPAAPRAMDNSRMQPSIVAYGSGAHAAPFAREGALVIAGRTNYDSAEMKQVSAAGGTVLVYLDAIIDNNYGRYASLLLDGSACGAAVPRWPGNIKANDWGYLTDFRPGSVVQGKLECVLETIVRENPHIGGFFADDLGSRSWFPNINWGTFGAGNQQAYRDGAIGLSKTFRKVADRHGLVFMVNGTWEGGSVGTAGGGYPNASAHGNALADGAMAEHQTAGEYWGRNYPCAPQWADQSAVTKGKSFHMAVTYTRAELDAFGRTGCYAFGAVQGSYDSAPVWGGFSWTGLPSRVTSAG